MLNDHGTWPVATYRGTGGLVVVRDSTALYPATITGTLTDDANRVTQVRITVRPVTRDRVHATITGVGATELAPDTALTSELMIGLAWAGLVDQAQPATSRDDWRHDHPLRRTAATWAATWGKGRQRTTDTAVRFAHLVNAICRDGGFLEPDPDPITRARAAAAHLGVDRDTAADYMRAAVDYMAAGRATVLERLSLDAVVDRVTALHGDDPSQVRDALALRVR